MNVANLTFTVVEYDCSRNNSTNFSSGAALFLGWLGFGVSGMKMEKQERLFLVILIGIILASTLLMLSCNPNFEGEMSNNSVSSAISPAPEVTPPSISPTPQVQPTPTTENITLPSPTPSPSVPSPSQTTLEIGKPAPDFELIDLDGKAVTLSSFRGQPVLINFWGTWCLPCLKELPFWQEINKNWTDKGLVFLSVDNGETKGKVQSFIQLYGYTFRVLVDPEGEASIGYGIRSLPTTVLVDRDGIVQYILRGPFPNVQTIEQEVLTKVFPK
jgi:peroxiredoxin